MSDKKDDPHIIQDEDLDQAQGGMKIPNLFSGDGKVVDSFDLGTQGLTIDAKFSKDQLSGDKGDVLIQNIGFPDDSKLK